MKINRIIMGIIILIFSIVYYFLGINYPQQARIFPNVLTILLLIFSIIMILQGLNIISSPKQLKSGINKREIVFLIGIAVALILYVILMNIVGFIPITIIYLISGMWYLGYREWWKNILISVLGVIFIYYIFTQIMYVPLPSGIVGYLNF